jgi:hypothetical protein
MSKEVKTVSALVITLGIAVGFALFLLTGMGFTLYSIPNESAFGSCKSGLNTMFTAIKAENLAIYNSNATATASATVAADIGRGAQTSQIVARANAATALAVGQGAQTSQIVARANAATALAVGQGAQSSQIVARANAATALSVGQGSQSSQIVTRAIAVIATNAIEKTGFATFLSSGVWTQSWKIVGGATNIPVMAVYFGAPGTNLIYWNYHPSPAGGGHTTQIVFTGHASKKFHYWLRTYPSMTGY